MTNGLQDITCSHSELNCIVLSCLIALTKFRKLQGNISPPSFEEHLPNL